MKIIEENYLKNIISQLNKHLNGYSTYNTFIDEIEGFESKTLQDLSFKTDLEFFDEISLMLSIISSIISHPLISNKFEDVIVRTEQAPLLSSEKFMDTLKDPSLWKEDGLNMIPEYVHYQQNIDEIRIYENRFICHILNLIEMELTKYNDFYISMIHTIDGGNTLSLENDNSEIALEKLKFLTKKVRHIKNTRFYRAITSKPLNINYVHATNILTKNNLYNKCYKFYKKHISYHDKNELISDFRLYYFVLFIKNVKKLGYVQGENELEITRLDNNLVVPRLTFKSTDFDLKLSFDNENNGLILEVINNHIKNKKRTAKHLLLFDSASTFTDLKNDYISNDSYDSIDAISIWNMATIIDEVEILFNNPHTELELMDEWILSKTLKSIGSENIYKTYCPCCKSKLLEEKEGYISCDNCHSAYTFYKDKKSKSNIWFIKIGRV